MSKFDTCIYAEYFGDYGMNLCNHPSRGNDHSIYEEDCRKCKLHTTHTDVVERCPFCGKKAYLDHFLGDFHIVCRNCHVEMKDNNIDRLIGRWNKRFERKQSNE